MCLQHILWNAFTCFSTQANVCSRTVSYPAPTWPPLTSYGNVPPQVLCNVDELFERDELSAAPDPGWPDCFNSGVFVFRPSFLTHRRLLDHALQHGSFDGEAATHLAFQVNALSWSKKKKVQWLVLLSTLFLSPLPSFGNNLICRGKKKIQFSLFSLVFWFHSKITI